MPNGMESFDVRGKYLHAKSGKPYEVLGIARHSETLEEFIVYRPLYDNALQDVISDFWVRPRGMFFEAVEVDGQMVPRFARVEV